MKNEHLPRKHYFELVEHNSLQITIFITMVIVSIALVFNFMLPTVAYMMEHMLDGNVYNGGEMIPYFKDSGKIPDVETSYFSNWAIDIYVNTPQEARYWFNPSLSLFIPTVIIGTFICVFFTLMLPQKYGLIHQKIERELINVLDTISFTKHGYYSDDLPEQIEHDILHANLRDMHDYVEEWHISLDDLLTLQKALRWREGNILYRVLHVNDYLGMYMRFYFTVKFNNTILGLVYVGAAVLIIIIGLRGLKFIPSTQPSLVFFALGLEFTLLITYAVTLMYGRNEEEQVTEHSSSSSEFNSPMFMTSDYGHSKDIENLLRVFIKKNRKKRTKDTES